MSDTWYRFLPKVFKGFPDKLATNYAYVIAAAHHGLPHTQLQQYVVSNVHGVGEGWRWVDELNGMSSLNSI